jgi:hypothetical protein
MPPSPEIPISTNRRFSITALPQGIYLGLDISHNTGDHTYSFAVSVHDGSYSSDYYTDTLPLNLELPYKERIADAENRLIEVMTRFARGNHYKVQSVGVSLQVNDADSRELLFSPPSITSKLWFELDAIPFIMETNGRDIDERASSAVRKSVIWYVTAIFRNSHFDNMIDQLLPRLMSIGSVHNILETFLALA